MKDKKRMISIPEKEYRRLIRLDERQEKMKPLILQLAAFVRTKRKRENKRDKKAQ